MSILNYLPSFKVVEVNRSTALIAGHVISQFKLNPDSDLIRTINEGTEEEMNFIENGFILGIDITGEIDKFNPATHKQPFLHFTEELNRTFPGHKRFAVEWDADEDIYPRLLALYVGDAFTTDNYDEDSTTDPVAAKVVNGVLTLQDVADSDSLFLVEESSLPTGEDAYRFVYVGISA